MNIANKLYLCFQSLPRKYLNKDMNFKIKKISLKREKVLGEISIYFSSIEV